MLKITSAIAAVVLTAGVAAADEARWDVDLYRGNPSPEASYTQAAARGTNARTAFASARSERATQGNAFAVYRGGRYAGQDPDANVRLDLQRETDPQ